MDYLNYFKNSANFRRLFKFLVSGGTAAVVEYSVFLLLLDVLHVHILAANLISFFCGLVTSFVLNRKWVFKSDNSIRSDFLRYFILAVINSSLSSLIIAFLVSGIGIIPYVAKLIVMITIAIWNYVIFSKFIFKTR